MSDLSVSVSGFQFWTIIIYTDEQTSILGIIIVLNANCQHL